MKFSYKETEPLIENMNLDIKKGETVAIVGPTGAGKTTLVNLLMRFYEINGGKITFDGVDVRDIRRGSLRTMFGMASNLLTALQLFDRIKETHLPRRSL